MVRPATRACKRGQASRQTLAASRARSTGR